MAAPRPDSKHCSRSALLAKVRRTRNELGEPHRRSRSRHRPVTSDHAQRLSCAPVETIVQARQSAEHLVATLRDGPPCPCRVHAYSAESSAQALLLPSRKCSVGAKAHKQCRQCRAGRRGKPMFSRLIEQDSAGTSADAELSNRGPAGSGTSVVIDIELLCLSCGSTALSGRTDCASREV